MQKVIARQVKKAEHTSKKIQDKDGKNNMKNIIQFSKTAKNNMIHLSSGFLAVVAVAFASIACAGHFYEAEVPQKLRDDNNI